MKSTSLSSYFLLASTCVALFTQAGCQNAFAAGHPQQMKTQSPAGATTTVEALVYSTLPSTFDHRPEMAMDTDISTYFKSASGMDDGDDFLVLFQRPIPVQSIHILTGDANGASTFTNGFAEVSPDGVTYNQLGAFDSTGVLNASPSDKLTMAIRIRVDPGQYTPSLILREISIRSTTKISHVELGPGRGFYDISQAPDLSDWARHAETQMEEFWPDTQALLYTDKFIAPNMVNVVYRTGSGVTPVAATGGGVMTVNSAYCREFPNDTALTVHETAHVIQAYSNGDTPGWLVEGIADYVRWVKFEPESFHPRINPDTASYHDAYQTTATFLGWCALHYDSGLVTKLNAALRSATYNDALFKTYCGKDVDTLWTEFIADYRKDPANVIRVRPT